MSRGASRSVVPLTPEPVLAVVEIIPRGKVMTYGDVAEFLGDRGPRSVARALSRSGGGVPWWRVVRADGSSAEPVRDRQVDLLVDEGVAFRRGRVDLATARWDGVSRS